MANRLDPGSGSGSTVNPRAKLDEFINYLGQESAQQLFQKQDGEFWKMFQDWQKQQADNPVSMKRYGRIARFTDDEHPYVWTKVQPRQEHPLAQQSNIQAQRLSGITIFGRSDADQQPAGDPSNGTPSPATTKPSGSNQPTS